MTEPQHAGARPRLELIQMLRGMAALMVVMFHARTFLTPSPNNDMANWLFASGASGVDMFFVISGFVMVYTTQGPSGRDPRRFVARRLTRIVPPYIVVTILFALVMRLTLFLTQAPLTVYHLDPQSIVQSLLFYPLAGTDPPLWGSATLHVGWSLNYEMYFYAIFAVSLPFGRARWLVFFGWVVVSLVAVPLVFAKRWSIDAYVDYGWSARYLNLATSPMVWEFVSGVLVGLAYQTRFRIPNGVTAWLAVSVTVALAGWILLVPFNLGFGLPRWGFVFVLLLLVMTIADKTLSFRVPPMMIWLGDISFSLYLVHPLVIEPIEIGLQSLPPMRPLLIGLPFIVFMTVLSVAAAAISRRTLEIGLSDAIRPWVDRALGIRPRPARMAVIRT